MSTAPTPGLIVEPARLTHVVISASAGSGKTHALSSRYLSLIAAGENPSRILATTFTRAAAGEIRDRLLKRLAQAAIDDRRRRELADSIGVEELTSGQAITMLMRLTGNLQALQIRTLDSFFASVVRAFPAELGLPLECTVIDEHEDRALRLEALSLMLDERDPQPMIDLLRLLTRGDSDRGVTRTIDATINGLYELWRATDERAWDWIKPPAGLLDESSLSEAIDSLSQATVPGDGRFAEAFRSDVDAAMRRAWSEFLGRGIAKVIASGERTYYRKLIDPDLVDAYIPVVRHAVAELLHRVREQTRATATLVRSFHDQYSRLKQRSRVLTFDDLTQAMIGGRVGSGESGLGSLDDIGYRLDARVHHLLLDEFQDTSGVQWRAIRGMAEEIASQLPPDRSFFCVGDVKQSIYGWRGASPDILERLPDLLPGVQTSALNVSWRSSPVVIESVNEVYKSIGENPAMAGDPAHAEAGHAWQSMFHRHEVAEKLRDAPGHVQMRTIERGETRSSAECGRIRLRIAADLAADLHARDRNLRIAILTRTNASVARVLFELGPSSLSVPASGRGGGPLIDAPPVNVILDVLHMADHPDDTVAAFNIANSPLGRALGFTQFNHQAQRWRLARQIRERLLLDGYQRTLADWVKVIAPSCDARELRRLTQLVEMAGLHDSSIGNRGLRTAPFIELVERKDVPDSQPAPIEVMTIHQSKGLEFDAVILPDLAGRLKGGRDPLVAFDRDASGNIVRIARYANEEIRQQMPELEELTRATHIRAVRESLAVLYVAMTRARHGLYMIIDPPAANEKTFPKTIQGVLRGALAPDDAEPGTIVYERGEADWIELTSADRAQSSAHQDHRDSTESPAGAIAWRAEQRVAAGGTTLSPSAIRDRVRARSKAESLREQLQLTDPEGRERGTVIHALFEQIEWLDDFQPDERALLAVTRRIAPRRDDHWHRRQIAAFQNMLSKPGIREALTRGGNSQASMAVYREWPFARLVDGAVQTGIIDRVVLEFDSHRRAVRGTVIDFKTDAIVGDMLHGQAEVHREQLEAYREVISGAFKLDESSVHMQVVLLAAGVTLVLPHARPI